MIKRRGGDTAGGGVGALVHVGVEVVDAILLYVVLQDYSIRAPCAYYIYIYI